MDAEAALEFALARASGLCVSSCPSADSEDKDILRPEEPSMVRIRPVFIYGESLGGAVAMQLAARYFEQKFCEAIEDIDTRHVQRPAIRVEERGQSGVGQYEQEDLTQQAPAVLSGLILQNTFTSISQMIRVIYPHLFPLTWIPVGLSVARG